MPSALLIPNVVYSATGWTMSPSGPPPLTAIQAELGYTTFGEVGEELDCGFDDFAVPSGNAVTGYQVESSISTSAGYNIRIQLFVDEGSTLIQEFTYPAPIFGWRAGVFVAANANPNGLRLKVYVIVGVAGVDFLSVRVFYEAATAPTTSAVVVSPATPITTTRTPTVSWTYTQGSYGADQSYYGVRIFSAAQYDAGGFDPNISATTYEIQEFSSIKSHILNTSLANGTTYKAYVRTYQVVNGVGLWSAWVGGSAFTIAIPVPVPTVVTPASASTVTTSRPAIGASVAAMATGVLIKREWQLATNNIFTTGLLTVTEGTTAATKSGTITFPVLPTRLAQGLWWIRARTLDQYGQASGYTAAQSFTVAHVPSTGSRAPAGGIDKLYAGTTQVSWTFSDIDPEDFQFKYQAQLWKLSAPGSPIDSGLLTSVNPFHNFTIPDATWKDTEIRWKVLVHDQDDVSSGYSVEQSFFLRDAPVVAVISPTPSQVLSTPAPLITWSFTAFARTQAQWKVDITNNATFTLAITSEWQAGTNTSWQVPSPAVVVGPSHTVKVWVIDSSGLTDDGSQDFTANYATPTLPTASVDGSVYSTTARNTIDWSGATLDSSFGYWRVYRRNVGTLIWTLLFETSISTVRSYKDYTAPSQVSVEYAVVQASYSFGVLLESAYVGIPTVGTVSHYFLVCPENDALNMKLYHVSGDSFTDEQEMETRNIIGRGRRVEYGTRYGKVGSLTASFRDQTGGPTARTQRLIIEALRDSQLAVYMVNPFGDVWEVAIGAIPVDRTSGVGLHEMASATIAYTEITV